MLCEPPLEVQMMADQLCESPSEVHMVANRLCEPPIQVQLFTGKLHESLAEGAYGVTLAHVDKLHDVTGVGSAASPPIVSAPAKGDEDHECVPAAIEAVAGSCRRGKGQVDTFASRSAGWVGVANVGQSAHGPSAPQGQAGPRAKRVPRAKRAQGQAGSRATRSPGPSGPGAKRAPGPSGPRAKRTPGPRRAQGQAPPHI